MKSQLRNEMRERMKAIPPGEAAEKSQAACSLLIAEPVFRNSRTIMIYLSIPGEVDTRDLATQGWKGGKSVLVPKVDWEHKHMDPVVIRSLDAGVREGRYGIPEPVEGEPHPLDEIDLIVVPAVAFDRRGYRLGRGGGYYDRFLAHPQVRAVACGLGFEVQVVDQVPTDSHDHPIDMLVTEKQVLQFAPPRQDTTNTKEKST